MAKFSTFFDRLFLNCRQNDLAQTKFESFQLLKWIEGHMATSLGEKQEAVIKQLRLVGLSVTPNSLESSTSSLGEHVINASISAFQFFFLGERAACRVCIVSHDNKWYVFFSSQQRNYDLQDSPILSALLLHNRYDGLKNYIDTISDFGIVRDFAVAIWKEVEFAKNKLDDLCMCLS